jgi:RNA polymerase subunit RPABC4/transcription elongation factor Spt4
MTTVKNNGIVLVTCINEECGKVAPRDKSWRKSKVIENADICKECFEKEMEALGMQSYDEEHDEEEMGREEEGDVKSEQCTTTTASRGEKKENGETLIGKILAAFGGESGKERASAIASTSQVCQKCNAKLPPTKMSSGSHTFAEQETDKEVAAVLSLCRDCYREEISKLRMKVCTACASSDTTGGWYRSHVQKGAYLCHRCYYRERATLSTKVCSVCNSDRTSGSWLKSKTVEGGYLCVNCYYKELVALSGKHCGTCGSKKTSSIWYNDKVQSGKYLCAKCYARVRKQIKNQKKIEGRGNEETRTTTATTTRNV